METERGKEELEIPEVRLEAVRGRVVDVLLGVIARVVPDEAAAVTRDGRSHSGDVADDVVIDIRDKRTPGRPESP